MKYLLLLLFTTSLYAERNIQTNTQIHNAATSSGNIPLGTGGVSYPAIASGTYTPTASVTSNLSATVMRACNWIRVGNVVSVSGQLDMDPINATTVTYMGITLPVPTTLSTGANASGGGSFNNVAGTILPLMIYGGGSLVYLEFYSTAEVANGSARFTFMYLVE